MTILNLIYKYWLSTFPVAFAATLTVGLVQISINPAGEDFLVGLFFLLTTAIAVVTSLETSFLIKEFGMAGIMLILPGVVAVLSTAQILTYASTSAFSSILGYGFPLPWWEEVTTGRDIPRPITEYNGFFFMLDTLFFTTVGYVLVVAYLRLGRG